MSLEVKIMDHMKEAMKAKDTVALEALRAIKSAIILAKKYEAKKVTKLENVYYGPEFSNKEMLDSIKEANCFCVLIDKMRTTDSGIIIFILLIQFPYPITLMKTVVCMNC